MVMGPTHGIMGFGSGLVAMATVPAALGHPASVPLQLAGALLCSGAAIAPDLDHPEATASRSLGPLTGLVARGLARLSGWLYRHTKTSRDSDRDGTHRGLTHTGLGAILLGLLVGYSCGLPGPAGVILTSAWTFLFALFALRALPPRCRESTDMLTAAALTGAAWFVLPAGQANIWLGACVVLGCWVHDLGDTITYSGTPFLYPLVIRGRRWYPVRPPYGLRIAANGPGDIVVRWLSGLGVIALLINLIPDAWSRIFGGVGWAWSHVMAAMPG